MSEECKRMKPQTRTDVSKEPHCEVSTVQAGLLWPGSDDTLVAEVEQSFGKLVPVSIWMPRPVGSKMAERPVPRIGLLPQVWKGFLELMKFKILVLSIEWLSIA